MLFGQHINDRFALIERCSKDWTETAIEKLPTAIADAKALLCIILPWHPRFTLPEPAIVGLEEGV